MTGTAIYVIFRAESLDLTWLPPRCPVVIVHNDDSLTEIIGAHRVSIRHIHSPSNVGFGAAVNMALPCVTTQRTVLVNPDTKLLPSHWTALTEEAGDDTLITVPLIDPGGAPTSIVNRMPSPGVFVAGAMRLGSYAPLGSRRRQAVTHLLGSWGGTHREGTAPRAWPLEGHWASGAVLSIATARLRAVEGFDESYFLYYEDLDLCARLAARFPTMTIRVAGCEPGLHHVGGSSAGDRSIARLRRESARRYATSRPGIGWRIARFALAAMR